MDVKELSRGSLGPFDNLAVIRRYFSAVKSMDAKALKGTKFDVGTILDLWHRDGQLRIRGEAIGERKFNGHKEMRGFYANRTHGADGAFSANLSRVNIANAKNHEHVTVSGVRYVVNKQGEGLQAPFTHNFDLKDGKIVGLEIHVGKAEKSEVAPLGTLKVEDLGRLSAMAWMVA
jgi:hypothetical protein